MKDCHWTILELCPATDWPLPPAKKKVANWKIPHLNGGFWICFKFKDNSLNEWEINYENPTFNRILRGNTSINGRCPANVWLRVSHGATCWSTGLPPLCPGSCSSNVAWWCLENSIFWQYGPLGWEKSERNVAWQKAGCKLVKWDFMERLMGFLHGNIIVFSTKARGFLQSFPQPIQTTSINLDCSWLMRLGYRSKL